MAGKFKASIRIKTAEILLAFLVVFSGVLLGFSGGGFVVNFNKVGLRVMTFLIR